MTLSMHLKHALAYSCLVGGAAYGQAPPQYYFACTAQVQPPGRSTQNVVAKVFPAEPGLKATDSAAANGVKAAWYRYLFHKYFPEDEKKLQQQGVAQPPAIFPGTCRFGNLAQAQNIHDTSLKGGAIEEDWIYTPGTPPPQTAAAVPAPAPARCDPTAFQHRANIAVGPDGCPVAAVPTPPPAPTAPAAPPPAIAPKQAPPTATPAVAAAPAAPKKIWGVCSARAPEATYFSEPFEASAGTNAQWSKKFREMLVGKYQFTGTGGLVCSNGATLEAVQKIAEQQRKTAPPRRPTVDTGWKFQ
jgi:hypothetical protein